LPNLIVAELATIPISNDLPTDPSHAAVYGIPERGKAGVAEGWRTGPGRPYYECVALGHGGWRARPGSPCAQRTAGCGSVA